MAVLDTIEVAGVSYDIKDKNAYVKPQAGIPASDLASGVIPDVSNFITKSVDDLANYYLKSETYTKDEVAALIGAIRQFHYEVYPSLASITSPASNVLYLIGPTGSGSDKYEEYVYSNSTFVKIGDTSIDLSGYVTTTALNTALATKVNISDIVDNLTTNDATKPLSAKQGKVLDEKVSQLGQEVLTNELELSSLTVSAGTIYNNKWRTSGGHCVFLPITPGKKYRVTRATAGASNVAVLTQSGVGASDSTPAWATGYEGLIVISPGESVVINTPQDGNYLYIRTDNGSVDLTPKVFSSSEDFNERIEKSVQVVEQSFTSSEKTQARTNIGAASEDETNELKKEVIANLVTLDGLTVSSLVINSYKSWSSTGGTCCMLPITPGKNYRVYAKDSGANVAVLNQATAGPSNTTPVWATGYSDRIVVSQGDNFIFTAPNDAQALYVRLTNQNGDNLAPQVFTEVEDFNGKIDGLKTSISGLQSSVGALEAWKNDFNEFPFALKLAGDGNTYVYGNERFTLYPGTYRINFIQWEITGLSFSGAYFILSGKDSNEASVIITQLRNGTELPKYLDAKVDVILHDVHVSGRVKSGEIGIVTLDTYEFEEDTLQKNIWLENGFFDGTVVGWATNHTDSIYRISSACMLADDVVIDIPWGFKMMAYYGVPGQIPSGSIPYRTGSVRITKSMGYVRFIVMRVSETALSVSALPFLRVTSFDNVILSDALDFPVMSCGSKMLSRPCYTYAHLPTIRETLNYIFIVFAVSETTTTEYVGYQNIVLLCVIDKASGVQWNETIFAGITPDTVDGNNCQYYHTFNMIDVSDNEVVITAGCVNGSKFLFVNKTYNAATRTLSAVEKSVLSYGGSEYDFNLANYIGMANSVYSLSIPVIDKAADSTNIWNPAKYDDSGTTKYIALFSMRTNADNLQPTPYIVMTSEDAKTWTPKFLIEDDMESGETQIIVFDDKLYMTNRIGGTNAAGEAHGQFYGVCDMSGNMLKAWTKLNVQRTKPYIVSVGGIVYIIYNDGNNSGKYWGRTKVKLAKVNADYTITDLETYQSPHGINYPSICDHNGTLLIAYCEDRRGYNVSNNNNAITNVAIAQINPEDI